MTTNGAEALTEASLLRETLRQVPAASVTVAGESMAPLLRRGDLIGVAPLVLEQLAPGQVVTFADPLVPGQLQTHRLVAVDTAVSGSPRLLTRGDRALTFDPPVAMDQLMGRVLWRQREGRKLALDQGSGLWLSGHLGRVAERERRWASSTPLPTVVEPAALAAANARARTRVGAPWVRLLRLGSRAWSSILTSIIDITTAAPASAATREL